MSMGSGSGAPVMTDIQITKRLDRASNALFNAALNAEHLTEVEFQMRIGSGDKPQTAQKIVLTNGIVTGVHSSGSGAHVIETITLSFEKFKAAYQQQDAKGNKVGGPVEVELDLTKRK
jgi:type VI protein secretion system component Hcp